MSKPKTRKELPRVKVKITTGPATVAGRRVWQQFWNKVLTRKAAAVGNKE